jgi:hypothetical protein
VLPYSSRVAAQSSAAAHSIRSPSGKYTARKFGARMVRARVEASYNDMFS